MPYVAREDVGTTKRRSLSGRRRLEVWEKTGGTCVLCDRRIDGVRERWIVEHIRALELGGTDDIDNMGPAHEACGREKTLDDHARAAEAKRQKIRHLGAVVVARPLPGSRTSALKRKVDGTVVLRKAPSYLSADIQPIFGRGRAVCHSPTPFWVDAAKRPENRLCVQPALSAKKNGSGTPNQTAHGSTPMMAGKTDDIYAEVFADSEILPAIPARLDVLFADRPLLPGENDEQYDALLCSIVEQVKPADVIEAIWVKDVVDLIWEVRRLRRWRGQILVQARLKAVENLILPSFRDPVADFSQVISTDSLAAGWITGREDDKSKVDSILQERGLTAEDVTAHSFLMNLPAIERIDRLVLMADQRRDALLREVDRKRASFAQRMRLATADSLDADQTEVL